MQSYTPAYDKIEHDRKIAKISLCGKNMGPHDYFPIEWYSLGEDKRVTKLMCKICFAWVMMDTLEKMHGEVKL